MQTEQKGFDDSIPDGFKDSYDVVILGTGLTQSILSGLLAVARYKVLHVDKNNYYGAATASVDITTLFQKFRKGAPPPAKLGKDRDFAVDLCPKFMMASGELVKVLIHTKVHTYLTLRPVGGSFVWRKGRLCEVPVTPKAAASSSLMGMIQKYRVKKFLSFVADYEPGTTSVNMRKTTMGQLYNQYGLDENTQEFLGHAVALHISDDYKNQPAHPTLLKMQLYNRSLFKYAPYSSPYIYPKWGLGELPQAFSRLSAIWQGTFMLRTNVKGFRFGDDGKVNGVIGERNTANTKYVVCAPEYTDKTRFTQTGKIVRAICLINHPIQGTGNADSAQIIIPARQLNRKYNIYISSISDVHKVVPKGMTACSISTVVETENPAAELNEAFKLATPILERFIWVDPILSPIDLEGKDNIFVTHSYDSTTNFQSVLDDVWRVYKQITGNYPDLSKKIVPPGQEESEKDAKSEAP